MKHPNHFRTACIAFLVLMLVCLVLTSCQSGSDIASINGGATYTDPQTGQTFGGTVGVTLRDRQKQTGFEK